VKILRSEIDVIEVGQQIKTGVHVVVKSYPIGFIALSCSYEYYRVDEEIRVLLPVHIFKMLSVRARDDSFRAPRKIEVVVEKKIVKVFSTLCGYFKGANMENSNVISASIIHKHTETKLLCDILFLNGVMTIEYEHRSGKEQISEYIIGALCFLLRKK
jgi:hypothetical protein